MENIVEFPDKLIEEILNNASSESYRNWLIIKALLGSGLRISELNHLRIANLDDKLNTIKIIGKGNKIRIVDISPELVQLLKMYSSNKKLKKSDMFFPLHRSQLYRIVKRITNYNPHMLRHNYAIRLLRKTGNIRYVQKQLGHDSLSTTQIYLKYMDFAEAKQKLISLWK